MSNVPKKLVSNVGDKIQQYIDLTPEEIQQRELDAIAAATARAEREAEEAAKVAAKAAAIEKLSTIAGLTPEEIAAL